MEIESISCFLIILNVFKILCDIKALYKIAIKQNDRWTIKSTIWITDRGGRKRRKPKRRWVDDIAKFDKDWVDRAADREDWRSRREAFAQQWAVFAIKIQNLLVQIHSMYTLICFSIEYKYLIHLDLLISFENFKADENMFGYTEEPFSAEKYMDKLLDNVRYGIKEKNLDPLALPTTEESFQKRLIEVNKSFLVFPFISHKQGRCSPCEVIWKVSGGIKCEDGVLKGLSTIDRTGRATVVFKSGKLVVEANLAFNSLHYSSRATVWFGALKFRPTVSASVSHITAYMRFSQSTADVEEAKPYLEEIDIREIGKFKSKVKGLGPLGWALSKVTSFLANILKKVIANKIEGPIEKLIRKNLHHINLNF
ncbi:hypothetical protein GQR58_017027 [Nymphon striatum]|nr:hypothetical protein GQR58_017027 [Nymphon striatum]